MDALPKWLEDNDISHSMFGQMIGKNRSTVGRIARGLVSVDRDTARAIFVATVGAITPNHLYGVQQWAPLISDTSKPSGPCGALPAMPKGRDANGRRPGDPGRRPAGA